MGILDKYAAAPNARADEALYYLGYLYFADLKDNKAAAETFARLAALPESQYREEAGLRLGDARFFAKDYAGAREAYAAFTQAFPASRDVKTALDQIGLTFAQAKQVAEGVRYFNDMAAANATSNTNLAALATYEVALLYNQSGDYTKSNEACDAFQNSYADDQFVGPAVMYLMAMNDLGLKKTDRAINNFAGVATLYPESAEAPEGLLMAAKLYWQANQLEDAIGLCQQVVKSYGNRVRVDGTRPALEAKDLLVQLAQGIYAPRFDEARKLADAGKFDAALPGLLEIFSRTAKGSDLNIYAGYYAAFCYDSLKKFNEAKRIYKETLDRVRQSGQADKFKQIADSIEKRLKQI